MLTFFEGGERTIGLTLIAKKWSNFPLKWSNSMMTLSDSFFHMLWNFNETNFLMRTRRGKERNVFISFFNLTNVFVCFSFCFQLLHILHLKWQKERFENFCNFVSFHFDIFPIFCACKMEKNFFLQSFERWKGICLGKILLTLFLRENVEVYIFYCLLVGAYKFIYILCLNL